MEYVPRYPQPFSLSQAMALDPAVAWDEIARLRNSLLHLRRTQSELQEHLRELVLEDGDPEVSQAMKENEITIASQDERIFMLKLALVHHGHSVPLEQVSESLTSSSSSPPGSRTEHLQVVTGSDSNGLDDLSDRTPVANLVSPGIEEQENSVYL